MDDLLEPSLIPFFLLNRREVVSGRRYETLPPETEVTPFIRSYISSVVCIVHSFRTDGGVSDLLAMAKNILFIARFPRQIQ